MAARVYHATLTEIDQWSRIHREGVLILPLSVGKLWSGGWLYVEGYAKLEFRVARMSREVDVAALSRDDLTAACFPALRPGLFHRWWLGLPHGMDSRAMAVWVWPR